jgi:acetoin utilization deacetylase AcuC-like enzyme
VRRRDPLAGLQFTDSTYHTLSSGLRDLATRLCGGRIVFLLEGGYDLTGLAGGAADSFRALLGVAPAAADATAARALLAEPAEKVQAMLREVRAVHGL